MSAAPTLTAKERGDVPLVQQVLFYPVRERLMSGTNLRDFYERYVDALDAREFDRVDEFVHESIVMHSEPSSRAAGSRTWKSRPAMCSCCTALAVSSALIRVVE